MTRTAVTEPTDYPLLGPKELACQACGQANRHDYRLAADSYDQAADLADAWGDHGYADELREQAEACRSLAHDQLRRVGAV